jgi:hypothetical protein
MCDRIPNDIQEMVKSKKLDSKVRLQLVENITSTGIRLPTIERIFPLDNREMSFCLEQKEVPVTDAMGKHFLKGDKSWDATLKRNQRVTNENRYLYGFPESEDNNRVRHFIYCITPAVMSEDAMICVLSLLQRNIIYRKDIEPRYEYSSSLLYMKLPSRDNTYIDSNNDMNDKITSLDMDVKEMIIQLVKDRNRCFRNVHNNTFYEGRLMDRPIKLSDDCKAHIAVHQSISSPYLLTIALQDEFNALVSSVIYICVASYVNTIYLH